MVRYVRSITKITVTIVVSGFLGLCIMEKPLNAQENKTAGRLIQTMSEQDEYTGLINLELLDIQPLEYEDTEAAYEAVKPGIVKLSTESLYGSGVIYRFLEDSIIIVSSRHLLLYADKIEVEFFNGAKAEGSVVYLSEQADMGFIALSVRDIPILIMRELRQVRINYGAYREISTGTYMFHAGSADGAAMNMYEGLVADPWQFYPEFNSYMIHSLCMGRPGMSGGGTFDAFGNFIGMISGGSGEHTASLPLNIILDEYDLFQGVGM